MDTTERGIGHLFGLVGGGLIALGGLVAAVLGTLAAALAHTPLSALAALSAAVILWVVAGLVLLFAHLAEHGWQARPGTTGLLLVVLSVVAWAALGFGGSLLALIGGLFVFLAGVLYLIEPARRAALSLVAPA